MLQVNRAAVMGRLGRSIPGYPPGWTERLGVYQDILRDGLNGWDILRDGLNRAAAGPAGGLGRLVGGANILCIHELDISWTSYVLTDFDGAFLCSDSVGPVRSSH
jgi:hypothetical protein